MTSGLGLLLAEFMLIGSILITIMASAYADMRVKMLTSTVVVAPILLAVSAYILLGGLGGGVVFDKQLLNIDGIAQYSKFMVFLLTVGGICIAAKGLKSSAFASHEHKADYFPVILLSSLGICVMVSANDLMSFYMGLELQSLALYILVAFKRDSYICAEAALKYLILGAVGSGLFLFGTSLIFGIAGSVNYIEIYKYEAFIGEGLFFVIGAALILMALFYKLSAAPFHMWTPDVYQGAPSFVTAFLATAPKIAAAVGLLRLVEYGFHPIHDKIDDIILLAALLSLFTGSIMAVRQSSVYRMAAYSTITHMGYILLAISYCETEISALVLEYLTIYVLTSFGVFSILGQLTIAGQKIDKISDLAGLASKYPYYAASLTIVMLSLAGIPPLAGFFVKFNILSHVANHGHIGFAIAAVTASAISAFYYIRIIKMIYFDALPEENADHLQADQSYVHYFYIAPLVLMVFKPSFVADIIEYFIDVYGS